MLIFCLASPVEFYCKTCFEVLSIASPGTKIKMNRENNAYLILCCDAGTGYLIGTASSVLLLDHGLYYYLLPTSFSSETAVALLRESYTIF